MELINKNKVYAVVIWFHPTAHEVDHIRLYQKDVAGVIVVDNSETDNGHLLNKLSEIIYMPLMQNKGIGAALNEGCKMAQKQGAQWVLTMDQDSRWDQHSVTQYIEEVNQYSELDKVGIFSPFHDCDGHPEKHHQKGRFEACTTVMCSGNLLRLKAWSGVGEFNEEFFIDSVDDEMCCRLRRHGWQVIRANQILLTHALGNSIVKVRLIRHQYIPHVAWRYYYIARNIRRMMRMYPEMSNYYRRQLRKYIKRLWLYDWDDKWNKLREFRRGWRDA